MKKKIVMLLLFLWLMSCTCSSTKSDPNIIVILADDLGYNDLSCYRDMNPDTSQYASASRTLNLDELAAKGMLFTQFYCGAAVCSPSRAVLLTGRNATRTGIYNWIPPNCPMHLRNEEVTIAELLKQKDYQTAHFGKWHLTSEGMKQPLPNDQGFDYAFFCYNNAWPSHRNPENYFSNGKAVGPLEGYACQLVVDEAISWLEQAENHDAPFYINVWFNEPHEKVAAPDSLTSRHERNKEYYGAIENMDLAVGRLMDYLDSQGLTGSTIIMFSSDNGSQVRGSNLPLRGEKALNYEGGVRVPFIISWPGHVPAGEVSQSPGSFVDILPTLASVTGTGLPEGRILDGMDLSAVFTGESEYIERRNPIFFFRYFHDPVCMIRDEQWVLLGYDEPLPYEADYNQVALAKLKPEPGQPPWSMWGFQPVHMDFLIDMIPRRFELYNIEDDPGQRDDLANRYPEVTDRLRETMLRLRSEMIAEGGNWYE